MLLFRLLTLYAILSVILDILSYSILLFLLNIWADELL